MSHLNTALKIFKKLLEKGQIDREDESDLFLEFRNPEVREALGEFEEEMDFRIVEASSSLYLVPESGNNLLGFVTKDLREWVSSNARLVDAFLLCYISMFIVYLFYGGKNRNPKQREFLKVSTLLEELDRRLSSFLKEEEETARLEENHSLNFARIAALWDSKRDFEDGSRKTKVGTILNVCRLLEREKLIRMVDGDRELRTTKKMDELMLHYYLNESRVGEINSLFAERNENNAQD